MDSTSSPQVDSVNAPQPPSQPGTTAQSSTAIPVAQPSIQEAQAIVTVPNQGSPKSSKVLVWLLVFAILALVGAVAYFFYMKIAAQQVAPSSMILSPTPTPVAVTPAPQSEVQAVDQLDTTFPSTDAASIQNDLQGL